MISHYRTKATSDRHVEGQEKGAPRRGARQAQNFLSAVGVLRGVVVVPPPLLLLLLLLLQFFLVLQAELVLNGEQNDVEPSIVKFEFEKKKAR